MAALEAERRTWEVQEEMQVLRLFVRVRGQHCASVRHMKPGGRFVILRAREYMSSTYYVMRSNLEGRFTRGLFLVFCEEWLRGVSFASGVQVHAFLFKWQVFSML